MIKFLIATVLIWGLIGLKAQSDKPRYPVSDVYPNFEVVTSIPPKKTQISLVDSPQPPKYQYFYKATPISPAELSRIFFIFDSLQNQWGVEKGGTEIQKAKNEYLFHRNYLLKFYVYDSVRLPEPNPESKKPYK